MRRRNVRAAPLPPGTVLHADPRLQLRARGRVLVGGSPLRFFRLTDAGASLVRRWFGGEPPGREPGPAALARRLINAGMAHPEPAAHGPAMPLTVIIPVKDDQAGLSRTLAGLRASSLVVVDDGSDIPVDVPVSGTDGHRGSAPTVLRRVRSGGPAVARQDGLAGVTTPLVAFVDAGVDVTTAQLDRLCRWFEDPEVVAVGPRIVTVEGPGLVDRYEQVHSPLDLGSTPAAVGHGRSVSYLPTACLVVRGAAMEDVGGFDSALRFGEDVDLIWRLMARGQVRFDPSVSVSHPARSSVTALANQRFGYGLAAAPLAARHGSELAPVRVSGWSLGCWGLALVGRPFLALALGAYTAFALSRKLSSILPDSPVEATVLSVRGHWAAGASIADASVRVWWPLSALAALVGLGQPVRLLVTLAWLRKLRESDGPTWERLRQLGLGIVDDTAYGAGVWAGVWRARSPACLLPHVVNWPDSNTPDDRGPDGGGSNDGATGATGR